MSEVKFIELEYYQSGDNYSNYKYTTMVNINNIISISIYKRNNRTSILKMRDGHELHVAAKYDKLREILANIGVLISVVDNGR